MRGGITSLTAQPARSASQPSGSYDDDISAGTGDATHNPWFPVTQRLPIHDRAIGDEAQPSEHGNAVARKLFAD